MAEPASTESALFPKLDSLQFPCSPLYLSTSAALQLLPFTSVDLVLFVDAGHSEHFELFVVQFLREFIINGGAVKYKVSIKLHEHKTGRASQQNLNSINLFCVALKTRGWV